MVKQEFNYAAHIVAITQQSADLSKAQRNGNKALMVSISDAINKLTATLAYELTKELS